MREVTQDTTKYTKYEKARIIGSRALQLSMGAPMNLKLSEAELAAVNYNPVQIAKLEFDKGVIPLTVIREYPSQRLGKTSTTEQEANTENVVDASVDDEVETEEEAI